jgi:L-2,4-diaminobutyrate decarboxylase
MNTLDDFRRFFLWAHDDDASSDTQRWIARYFEHLRSIGATSSPFLAGNSMLPHDSMFPQYGRPTEEMAAFLLNMANGAVDWGNPTNAIAASAPPTSVAILSAAVCAHLNPNLSHGAYGQAFSKVELRLASMLCDLVGYGSESAGFSTFGAAASMYYAVRAGIKRAQRAYSISPTSRICVMKGAHSHASAAKAAAWLGLDSSAVVAVPSISGRIDLRQLEQRLRAHLSSGDVVASIIVEVGSTYDFALDDAGAVVDLSTAISREFGLNYRPYVHADAAVAGIYAVFATYDTVSNPLDFSEQTLEALCALKPRLCAMAAADSIGIDFHKLGFCPLTSAMHLIKDQADMQLLTFKETASGVQTRPTDISDYEPSAFTMESSRSASGVLAAYANCLLLGRVGYQQLYGHSLELSGRFRAGVLASPHCRLLNDFAPGPAVVFRVYATPEDAQTATGITSGEVEQKANAATKRVFSTLSGKAGIPALSLIEDYAAGTIGVDNKAAVTVIKGYFVSPHMTVECVSDGVRELHRACAEVGTAP